jgi:hypothetical protein
MTVTAEAQSPVTDEWASMGDAAYAEDLFGTSFDAAGGYLIAVNAFHSWSHADWATVPGPKLPIFVAPFGNKDGKSDGQSCLNQLRTMQIPAGSIVVLDMETMVDVSYVEAFWKVVHDEGGYRVWVYGSLDTVFGNPSCNGYWVADYTNVKHMVNHVRVRATQWKRGNLYDTSTVLKWCLREFWQ